MSESTSHIPLADCTAGGLSALTAGGREIVVCGTKDGIHAVDNICSHVFARLSEGRLRGSRVIYPLHGAGSDGRALGTPASVPLATHRVCLTDGGVEIMVADAASGAASP